MRPKTTEQKRKLHQQRREEDTAKAVAEMPAAPEHPAAKRLTGRLLQWEPLVRKYAAEDGVPPDLILAQMEAESRGKPDSTSTVGALGLMQVMPGTGREVARELGIVDPNLSDPETSIRIGVRYMRNLLEQFNGDEMLAVAAYNAGPSRVKRLGRVPNFTETRNYVDRIGGTLAFTRGVDGQYGFRVVVDSEGHLLSRDQRRSLAASTPDWASVRGPGGAGPAVSA